MPQRIQSLPVYRTPFPCILYISSSDSSLFCLSSTALWQPFLFYLSPQTSNIFAIFSTLRLLLCFRNHSFITFNLNTGHLYMMLCHLSPVGLELHALFSSLFPPSCSLSLCCLAYESQATAAHCPLCSCEATVAHTLLLSFISLI